MNPSRPLLLALTLTVACTDDPLISAPATTGSGTGASPTSFDPPGSSTDSTGEPTTTASTTTEATSTGATNTTTSPGEPMCGDGNVEGAEQCDLGEANANTGACTLECKHATCGDGLMWAGVEECDFGLGNNDDHAYGGCDAVTCTLGPRCGDGIVDPQHESCDRGNLNGTGITPDDQAPCTFTCGFFGRILFLTGQTWTGDLGGVSGGDLKCRVAAMNAGLPNAIRYRAWLSDDFQSPANRFDAWDSQPEVPVILVGGRVVAADLPALVEVGPATGIARTEEGSPIFAADAWTNTSAFGETFSITNHCAGWTSASNQFSARIGLNALPVEDGPDWQAWQAERWWTSNGSLECNWPAHLYCIDDGEILDTED